MNSCQNNTKIWCANDRVGAGNIPGACPRRENYEPAPSPSHSAPHPMLGHKFKGTCYDDCKGASNGDWWAKGGCTDYSNNENKKCGGCVGDANVIPSCKGPANGKIHGTICKGAHAPEPTCIS